MRNSLNRLGNSMALRLATLLAGAAIAGCANLESALGPMGKPSSTTSATSPSGPMTVGESEGSTAGHRQTSSDLDCPNVTVRSGASAWQVTAGSGATNVRYQGSLGQIARECAVLGETMTMRVGVEGRILVGPKGGPGTVNVPLRIALVQEGPQPRPLWSKFYSVPITVPPGASQAIFTQVEDDVTFPLPANRNLENYIVYVGFDPKGAAGAGSEAKSKAKPKAQAAPKSAKAPAPRAAKSAPPKSSTQPSPSGGSPFDPPPGHGR